MTRLIATPARLVVTAYALAVIVGSLLLLLPIATTQPGSGSVSAAIFTAVSAVCITGLTTVDTATYWTPFGQVVIAALMQIGGLGIMTLATLLALAVRGRLGQRDRQLAAADTHSTHLGDVRQVVGRVVRWFLLLELAVFCFLLVRFRQAYDGDWGTAAWHAFFHAISSVNNAGFALYSDSLVSFATDLWLIGVISGAAILGGIGYPVVFEVWRRWRTPHRWSLHTRLTVAGTVALLAIGFVAFLALEWTNRDTLGPMSVGGKLVGALGGTAFPRTVGFNSIDYASAQEETLLVTSVLMFIGGGSAGTAGGIKITTFLVLAGAMWAEIRGERDAVMSHRSISSHTVRQALTVALGGVALVAGGAMVLMLLAGLPLSLAMFEASSAFATVGLSAGVTPTLDVPSQVVLMLLMFVGRVGPITFATSMALRAQHRHRRYRLPEERPIIG